LNAIIYAKVSKKVGPIGILELEQGTGNRGQEI
jgi:hypothetical protein